MYYPLVAEEEVTNASPLGTTVSFMYGLNPTLQADIIKYYNDHFGNIFEMVRALRTHFNDTETVDAWYTRDLMLKFDSSKTDVRCPAFRWNYTDTLLSQYPTRFHINDDKFGLFSLREIIQSTIITNDQKINAQKWAETYRVAGWTWMRDILGKHTWYNVNNSLPMFTILDHTNQSEDSEIQRYSIKIQPTFGTVYIAMGSRMAKLFGYTPVGKTRPILTGKKQQHAPH